MASSSVEAPPALGGAGLWGTMEGVGDWIAHMSVYLWGAFLVTMVVWGLTGTLFAPYDPTAQEVIARLRPPLSDTAKGFHWLGTDQLGKDLFSIMIASTGLTLFIGGVATLVGLLIGVVVGMAAGFFGGNVDRVASRLSEAQTAMPMFLVAIFFLTVLGPTVLNVIIILPSLVWPVFARVVRAETLRLRDSLFIEAAIAAGCTSWTILRTHILPNVAPRIAVLAVIEIGHVMLAEAGLSFLGIGVQPPDITWGLLIARGRPYLAVAPWLAILPGLLLGLTVLALNMLSRRFTSNLGTAA